MHLQENRTHFIRRFGASAPRRVRHTAWTEAYEQAVNGTLDALPCVAQTAEREKYFLFSDTYYTFQRAVFVSDDTKDIRSFDDLSGKTVAVQMNSSHHSYMTQFTDIKLSLYPTVEAALRAVSNGTEIAFVGNFATSSYLAKSLGISNLKYFPIAVSEGDLSQSLGVPGQGKHQEVLEATRRFVATGLAAGKPIGTVVRAGETAQEYLEQGMTILITSANALFGSAAKKFVGEVR